KTGFNRSPYSGSGMFPSARSTRLVMKLGLGGAKSTPAPACSRRTLLLWLGRGRLRRSAQLGAVGRHVEDFAGVVGVFVQQAEPAGDFLVGFFLAAEIAAEA